MGLELVLNWFFIGASGGRETGFRPESNWFSVGLARNRPAAAASVLVRGNGLCCRPHH